MTATTLPLPTREQLEHLDDEALRELSGTVVDVMAARVDAAVVQALREAIPADVDGGRDVAEHGRPLHALVGTVEYDNGFFFEDTVFTTYADGFHDQNGLYLSDVEAVRTALVALSTSCQPLARHTAAHIDLVTGDVHVDDLETLTRDFNLEVTP